jgi:hypothetical protein
MAKTNKKIIVGSVLILCLFWVAEAKSTEATDEIFQIVSKRMKNAIWDKTSIVEVDINCDGKKDYAILGISKQGVTVALVVGPVSKESKIQSLEFRVGKHSQDSLCQLPVKLRIESLDYDPTGAVGKLQGFRSSKKCNAFGLTDDICDSFHFYWNHQAKTLNWWRL